MPYTKEKEKNGSEDITKMKTTQKMNRQRKTRNEWMEKMTMPITIQGRLDQFQDRSFIVRYNPKGDGNCQFSAVSYLLNRIGLYTSPRILRQNVVEYLRRNPTNNVGQPLELFVGRPWEIYLREMEQDGTYGDLVTLQAISNIYTIQICVLSTLGVGTDVDIQPQINSSDNVQSYPQVFLGPCDEGQDEHYAALSEKVEDHIDFFSVHNDFIRSEAKADDSTPDKSPDWRNLPHEIWEIIFKMVFQSCVFEWPHHICSVFNALHNTCDRFTTLIEVYFQSLPRIYIGISDVLSKEKKSRITVSVLELVRQLRSFSGPVLGLKRILSSKRWNSAWIELMPERFS